MSSTILLNRPDASSLFNLTVSPPIPREGLGAPKVTLLTVLVAQHGPSPQINSTFCVNLRDVRSNHHVQVQR